MTGDFDIATVAQLRLAVGTELIAPDGSEAAVLEEVWTDERFDRRIRDREIERRRTLRSSNPRYAMGWDFDIAPPHLQFWPIDRPKAQSD